MGASGVEFGDLTLAAPEPRRIPAADPRFRAEAKGDAECGTARIFVMDEVLADIAGFSSREACGEVGGFLVGGFHEDGGREFVVVEKFLRAENSRSMPAALVFTHDAFEAAWREIGRIGASGAPPPLMVGWHHTHPGYGTFLSAHDLFIHRSFFGLPWQVALVVDPKAGLLEFFGWRDGTISGVGFVLLSRA